MGKFKNVLYFIVFLLLNPRLLTKTLNGLYLPVFVQYEWLKKYEINTIIDVGAATGNVSSAVGSLFPNAKIYAFEPIEENYRTIKSKSLQNPIIVEKVAISNKNGRIKFYKNSYLPTSSLLPLEDVYEHKFPVAKKIQVETITLDSYFKDISLSEKIFLKIDTQGSELQVLQGAAKLLEKVSIIHIETNFSDYYIGQCLFGDIYNFLTKLGFVYKGSVPDGQFYPDFNLKLQENSIFIK